jgi:hypothetical protein
MISPCCVFHLTTVEPQEKDVDEQGFGIQVPAATDTYAIIKNCWARCFLCGPCRIKAISSSERSQAFQSRQTI